MAECISKLRERRFRKLTENEEVLLIRQGEDNKVFFAGEKPSAKSGRLFLVDKLGEIKGSVGFTQGKVSAKASFFCRIRSTSMAAELIEAWSKDDSGFDRQIAAIIRPILKECVLRRGDLSLLGEGIRKKLLYHGIELTAFEIQKVQYDEQTDS